MKNILSIFHLQKHRVDSDCDIAKEFQKISSKDSTDLVALKWISTMRSKMDDISPLLDGTTLTCESINILGFEDIVTFPMFQSHVPDMTHSNQSIPVLTPEEREEQKELGTKLRREEYLMKDLGLLCEMYG